MDYPYKSWVIVIVEPNFIPDLRMRQNYLIRLITKLENTWYRVKEDILENGVDPWDVLV